MIVRRLAFLFAVLLGVAMTQMPEFIAQYRQRLGGAIDELSSVVAAFDANSAQHGLTQAEGVDRLRTNGDGIVQEEGRQMQRNISRLQALRDTQQAFRNESDIGRLATFALHYDGTIARGALDDFRPAVPVSVESFILGLVGFVCGGSIVHLAGRPLRRRQSVRAQEVAA